MGRDGPPACQERGSQSTSSKENGEKAPLQEAQPIPAELCLPSQGSSRLVPLSGQWVSRGES